MFFLELKQSGEDYLEAILMLEESGAPVRSVDLARHLGFSRASVSRAVSLLRAGGLLQLQGSALQLTPAGRQTAARIYERHRLLTEVLVECGVPREVAERDACRMEHGISEESFEKLKRRLTGLPQPPAAPR